MGEETVACVSENTRLAEPVNLMCKSVNLILLNI